MEAVVVVPSGKVAAGKLVQAVAYGARIVRVDGDFDSALSITMKLVSENPHFYLMNSVNPFRIEGQKTRRLKCTSSLGGIVPDFVVLPVGNAGNISAYWKGFSELRNWGITKKVPENDRGAGGGRRPHSRSVLPKRGTSETLEGSEDSRLGDKDRQPSLLEESSHGD